MVRRSSPPFWFQLAVAVAAALVVRACLPHGGGLVEGGGSDPHVAQAFLGFLILLVSLVWKGVEVAGKLTLAAVAYSVKLLWLFATKVGNGLTELGHGVLAGLRGAWKFFEWTYEKVLKPAWLKFWRWFDKFRRWLDETIGPVLRWLRELRDTLLDFWKTYVRPWLDLIDVTRRVLRVLSSLGFRWARALDDRLGAIESAIERPFRLVLGKINEVINIVNRVVTLDGLVQRVALVRSLERDYIYAWRAAVNPWSKPLPAEDQKRRDAGRTTKGLPEVTADTIAYMQDRSGPSAPLLEEMTVIWRAYLAGK